MKLKAGVKIDCMQPSLLEGILNAQEVFLDAGQAFTITSITDGIHMEDSLHYQGLAVDFRIRDLSGITPQKMVQLLRAKLGARYDVVLENDHIHMEFDPTL
jgi:hypothetical protein